MIGKNDYFYYNKIMECPICGRNGVNKGGQFFCTNCEIFFGDKITESRYDTLRPTDEGPAEKFRERARKNFLKGTLIILVVFICILPIAVYLFINYTAYGFREKVMYKYGFTAKASSYLRSQTSIDVMNISEKKPFGITHSGYWKPGSKNVKLNTASDEVAIHEFAHAWWEEMRKDEKVRVNLIKDTLKLSKMVGENYELAIKRAEDLVQKYCLCSSEEKINYDRVDDHHLYAFMAEFTMGKFKDGSHKLPEFMWKYFDGLFSSHLRVEACFETNSCYFPHNNTSL